MRVRRLASSLVALGLPLLVAACGAFREDTPPSPFEEGGRGSENIQITVDNQDFRDATLYVDWNGVRQRVGTVHGKSKQTFSTPWRDHVVRLDVDFLGGGAMPVRDPVQVNAGDHLDFIIMAQW